MQRLRDARVLIRGAGELGSAVAAHLAQQGMGRILLVERAFPKAVRRNVCFSEAVFSHGKTVDGVTARFVMLLSDVDMVHELGDLAVTTQPLPEVLAAWPPDIYVEAAMLRSNWGLTKDLAPLVIALGPGYLAGRDCHALVETVRGPQLGQGAYLGRAVAAVWSRRRRSWASRSSGSSRRRGRDLSHQPRHRRPPGAGGEDRGRGAAVRP